MLAWCHVCDIKTSGLLQSSASQQLASTDLTVTQQYCRNGTIVIIVLILIRTHSNIVMIIMIVMIHHIGRYKSAEMAKNIGKSILVNYQKDHSCCKG